MKVDARKKVSKIQAEFKEEFGVGIRIYKGVRFAPDEPLHTLTAPGTPGGDIEFGSRTRVRTVEREFAKKFGIKIQVETRDGKLADNDLTLAACRR